MQRRAGNGTGTNADLLGILGGAFVSLAIFVTELAISSNERRNQWIMVAVVALGTAPLGLTVLYHVPSSVYFGLASKDNSADFLLAWTMASAVGAAFVLASACAQTGKGVSIWGSVFLDKLWGLQIALRLRKTKPSMQ